jgi:hypothetical protein
MHASMPSKCLTPLILLALLLGATVAQADSVEPSTAPTALEEAPEAEELEDETPEEECEEAEEEFEEGEITRAEVKEYCDPKQERHGKSSPGGILPEECLLRTFTPRAAAYRSSRRLELTIDYTTHEPTAATIEYSTGRIHLGTVRRQLGSRGIVHLSKHLSASEATKLNSSHRLDVEIRVQGAPSSCKRYYSDSAKLQHR